MIATFLNYNVPSGPHSEEELVSTDHILFSAENSLIPSPFLLFPSFLSYNACKKDTRREGANL